MRRTAIFAGIVLVLAMPGANAQTIFEDVSHSPEVPRRGDEVVVTVRPTEGVEIAELRLTHCRVEPSYACSIMTAALDPRADGTWSAAIPWQPRFFDGTTWVGYNILVTFENGTETKMPTENVPQTPEDLPPDADKYYFYRLAAAEGAPSIGLLSIVTALAFLLGGMRRRVHET